MKRIVLLLCVCLSLAGCSFGNDADERIAQVEQSANFHNLIVEKAEQLADENTFEDGDIYVDSIYYGNYSQSEELEMLALCKFKNNVHVAGLDRTLAIVFSPESMEVIAYKNFGADEVVLQCLPTEGESKILFLGRTTYQDITTQYVELYAIQDGEWLEIPLDGIEWQEDNVCNITDDKSLIVSTAEIQTVYNWDEYTEQFVMVTDTP